MAKSLIERILDPQDCENIVLYTENNKAVEFEQIALLPTDGELCLILRPVEALEGMAEDEALVFRVDMEGEEASLCIVEDDALVDRVFEEYYQLLDEENK